MNYELMVVANPQSDLNSLTVKLEKFIKDAEIQDLKVEKMGKKLLAFPISKQQEGEYFLFNFEAPGEAIGKITQNLRLEQETILRYLITKVSKVPKGRKVIKEIKVIEEYRRQGYGGQAEESKESKVEKSGKVIVKTVTTSSVVKTKVKAKETKVSKRAKVKGKTITKGTEKKQKAQKGSKK